MVEAWAAEADFDPAALRQQHLRMEWPPRSGSEQEFPEVDRAEWFDLEAAREKILPAQARAPRPPAGATWAWRSG